MAVEARARNSMEPQMIAAKVQELTDVELATLLCLVANQHCIIETEGDALDALQEELQLVTANVFGLSAVVVNCSSTTTFEDFSSGVLIPKRSSNGGDFSKNDLIFISHFHNPEDGFANLEESSQWVEDDRASLSSVVHKTVVQGTSREPVLPSELLLIRNKEVLLLTELSKKVNLEVEVRRYLHNVLTFLRMHRAVAGGISPQATKHFELLVKSVNPYFDIRFQCLAPLHNLEYVTPSLVALAARKIYRHRITIVAPEHERSMQYGSDLTAVAALLEGVTAEQVIEEVLAMVEVPL
ncbi:MAG: hypothetical protein Q9187_006523 [Circinaria calcarea]